ncbi:Crp/Fnr family transcriptional regulator [Microvirga lenta]|uniref:Crp/Fnr family transcriptional regulator n=1 Tax=Microvirga lenta TaxID=2881337 RepID=UPI001CFDDF55|nr:Crp/Fnr family transcriptional regulator [Microvirga lenta]MCB5174352.1 Crp/Fnr family transcriptional regulator [Microvirga lenta]
MIGDDAASRTRNLASGETLFRQGDVATGMFRVESGAIRLERTTFDGRRIVLHTSHPGQFFAEASLFAESYHCDALAIEASVVRCYPKQAVLEWVERDPTGATSLLASMARQLQGLRHQLELRSVRSARDRILLLLESRSEADGSVRLPPRIQDLAFELGLSREAVYRGLADLEEARLIARTHSSIRLLKPQAV